MEKWRQRASSAAVAACSLHQQPCLELPRSVARDGQVGALCVFETDIEAAAGQRRDVLDPRGVDDGAPMNAEEAPGIQDVLELYDRVVDAVRLAGFDRV